MKKIKMLSVICLTLLAGLMFVGCGFGSYDLQFVLPDGTIYKTMTYGPGSKLTTATSAPAILGYNFIGWSPTTNLDYVITIPYEINTSKLYAKYEINQDLFYNYSTIEFDGTSKSVNVDQYSQHLTIILIKNNTDYNISNITIEPNNSDFTAQTLFLRDKHAKPIADNDISINTIAISEPTSKNEFVLEINALVNGGFTIHVN